MEINFKVKPPTMPSYIRYETNKIVKKQDGINFEDEGVPVHMLTKEQAIEFAELMRKEFLAHWERQVEMANEEAEADRRETYR